jgi:hypothetical protein
MTILPMHFSDNPAIDAAARRLYCDMAPNPLDWRKTNADKTVAVIRENLHRAFGDYAASIRIPVH